MIRERLFALQDEKYGDFHSKLIPGLPREQVIGIRMPAMKKLAKELVNGEEKGTLFLAHPNRDFDLMDYINTKYEI